MRRTLILLLCLAVLCASAGAEATQTGNALGLKILQSMYVQEGNALVSPTSLALALNMAAAGAKGDTLTELNGLLNMEALDLSGVSAWMDALDQAGVKVANAGFVADGLSLQQEYVETLEQAMAAQWFSMQPDATEQVNEWVKAHTDGLIDQLFREIPQEISMMLVNAIALEADWALPFRKESSATDVFHSPTEDVETEFMHMKANLPYGEAEGVQFLRLDYLEGDLAMYIALPQAGGMEEALKDLAEHELDWFAPLSEPKKVELSLPKMDLESNESLMDALKALGMTVSSSDAADFSGMSQEPLYIADVRQAVRVQVDEEGTKAAAATAIGIATASAPVQEEIVEMNVNRPFIFAIAQKQTGTILFAGAVNNPQN